jgi:hypothetical protein
MSMSQALLYVSAGAPIPPRSRLLNFIRILWVVSRPGLNGRRFGVIARKIELLEESGD